MFSDNWTAEAARTFDELKTRASNSLAARIRKKSRKATKNEGLFKQVRKCIELLKNNPRYPGLSTHEFTSIENPFGRLEKVFVAYAQNQTPGAYRVFWCYGPGKQQITIIAITPHP